MSKSESILAGTVGAIVIGLGAMTLVKDSSVPPPPKPYDVAIYDVYTDLLETPQQSWLVRLIDPRPEAVLIRVETEFGQDHPISGSLEPEKRFKQAVDSAIADYLKRSTGSIELRKSFNLPIYDLFTKAEEEVLLQVDVMQAPSPACRAVQQKHPGFERWVELSAVGFNQDQTVAVLYVAERGRRPLCGGELTGEGGYRMLQKRNGRWYLIENQVVSDWIS